jgi:Tfp pilus assembly protein PilF
MKQHEKAVEDINETIRLNPKEALAFITRAVGYIELGQPDQAKQDYDEAIRLDLEDTSAYT